jgi:aminoglycoside phosphotransferase (APT) family kinase protein
MLLIPHDVLEQIVHRINPGDTLTHAEMMIGGASAQVILLNIKHTAGEIQKYLLRVHSEINRSRSPNIAQCEFKLLQTLHTTGLPVAQPHYLDVSGEIYSIPYLVVGYIEGAPDFSPQNLNDFIRQSAELLVKIHQVEQKLPSGTLATLDFLSDRAAHILWWLGYQPEQLDEELDEERLRTTLPTLFPLKQMNTATLLHGDFWAGNLIWRDGKLTGVIDWEDAEIGDPLSDLAIARMDMLWAFGKDAMLDFTRTYQTLMPHLDYSNLPQWDLFSALRKANQLADSAALWMQVRRPDVTITTMQQAHQWFVEQALAKLA